MMLVVIFSLLTVLMIINVPIAICIALATLGGVAAAGGQPLMIVVQRMFTGLDTFTLIAVPLFILAGRLMSLGGATRDLINVANALVGFLRGGLAYINVVASLLFAGMTGSAAADTASEGPIIIPAMIEKGYKTDFTVAITATSSIIGIMIPPSIPMVVYGVATNASIGKLFIGGIVPGLMTSVALIIVTAIISKKENYPREKRVAFKEAVMIVIRGIPAMLTVIIIVIGIRGGYFTPTEGAGIAAAYSFVLAVFYYKEIKIRQLPKIIVEVAVTTGQVTLMIATASALGWLFARHNIPAAIAGSMLSVTTNKIILLLIINVVLLFIGMFIDLSPAVIIFAPILLPIAVACGVDPVHFGVIMVVNLGLGLCTPPAGVCLFIACGIARASITSVIKGFLPFYAAVIVVLMLITYIPQLVMFLPNLLMK
jgi:C4-dicarboxylate transporter DctM subunit